MQVKLSMPSDEMNQNMKTDWRSKNGKKVDGCTSHLISQLFVPTPINEESGNACLPVTDGVQNSGYDV
jgi:hypothetical protein